MAARRTWHFFETFVGPEDHNLPPDNFQEEPIRRLAARTSPTNMGLSLLSTLAARDLGYLSVGGLLRKLGDTLTTMEALERYRGHFYNWYDTRTLKPLPPLYISSVDSGNLGGHLLTLGPGILELVDTEIIPAGVFAGLRDTCRIALELSPGHNSLGRLEKLLSEDAPVTLRKRFRLLQNAADLASQIATPESDEAQTWVESVWRSRAARNATMSSQWRHGSRIP